MYKAIDDERLSKINDLMNQAKTESQTAYKEKQDALNNQVQDQNIIKIQTKKEKLIVQVKL